jgi:deoxyribose-phosphate aldolase
VLDLNALARQMESDLAPLDMTGETDRRGPNGTPPRGSDAYHLVGDAGLSARDSTVASFWRISDRAHVADFIEHTLLRPDATRRDIERLCDEAGERKFAGVCVNPIWVPVCAMRLRGTDVGVVSVIGFPLGANRPEIKAAEAALAIQQGATELDVVASIGKIRSGDWLHVADDIGAVVRAAGSVPVKVILETALLTPVEIIRSTVLAREAGARFVKTSSGFSPRGGATAEAVALMRLVAGEEMGVKASGGIHDCSAVLRLLANGATRIGTSRGVAVTHCLAREDATLAALVAEPEEHAHRCMTLQRSS